MEAHRNTPLANESCAPLSEKLKPTQHILDSVYLIYHHYIKPDKMIYHSKLIENELVHLMNACLILVLIGTVVILGALNSHSPLSHS